MKRKTRCVYTCMLCNQTYTIENTLHRNTPRKFFKPVAYSDICSSCVHRVCYHCLKPRLSIEIAFCSVCVLTTASSLAALCPLPMCLLELICLFTASAPPEIQQLCSYTSLSYDSDESKSSSMVKYYPISIRQIARTTSYLQFWIHRRRTND